MATEYFTLVEFRALPDMDNLVKYPDSRVDVEAAFVVARIEQVIGTSFIARTVAGEVHDGGRDVLVLDKPYVISMTSATEDGVAVADSLRIVGGVLRRYDSATSFVPVAWASGSGNVAVTYQAGYASAPPADIKSIALQWTRLRMLTTSSGAGNDARATSQTTDMGVMNFTVADDEHPSGYPEVDATVVAWRDQLDVYGFA